jgi:hypothetical protein
MLRLQGAVARILPAIEATVAKIGASPMRPREIESGVRALATLTRTLRELNGLLGRHQTRGHDDDDDVPEDIDEFRRELARRIDAFVASRTAQEEKADEAR